VVGLTDDFGSARCDVLVVQQDADVVIEHDHVVAAPGDTSVSNADHHPILMRRERVLAMPSTFDGVQLVPGAPNLPFFQELYAITLLRCGQRTKPTLRGCWRVLATLKVHATGRCT
jgi:hypothetical protein